MPVKTIIAALDLEDEGDPVAARAIQLAGQHSARLIVVHAIEGPTPAVGDRPLPVARDAITSMLEREAGERTRQSVTTAPAPAEIVVETGRPQDVIDAVARHHAADLVLIGPGKPRNLREKVFGSTADCVLRSSRCPVLVVKAQSTGPYRRVIAAVDFTEMSMAAARMATCIAPAATMELVHAVEFPLPFEQVMLTAGTSQAGMQRYRRAKAKSAREHLRATLSQEDGLPPDARARITLGPAGDALIRLADRSRADLIALGTQGRNAVAQRVLGSVARRVVGAASCDVLVASGGERP